jgi:hypothetical protein
MLTRLVTACVVLTLCGAGIAPCAGWESTAQGRHDCCVEGQCPDQLTADSHSTSHSGTVSQPQADVCCATSEQQNQQQSSQDAGVAFLLAPLVECALSTVVDITPPAEIYSRSDRSPSPPAPLHLLFSVFLV